MFRIFGENADIPENVDERMKKTYIEIMQMSKAETKPVKSDKPAAKRFRINKILVAAAAVSVAAAAFAATAMAGMSNTEFFRSAFGSQGMDKAHYDKENYYYWERENADTDKVGTVLDDYVINIDKTFTVERKNENSGKDTYTIHVEKAVIDTNDIGFVTYSIEGPNLSDYMVMLGENDTNICAVGDGQVHFFNVCYAGNSKGDIQAESQSFLHYHENLDIDRSTGNKYYIVQSFAPGDKNDEADIVLKYPLPDGKSFDITISETTRFPSVIFQNKAENAYVSISPMGLADIGYQYGSKPYIRYNVLNDSDTIIIKYKNGSEYQVLNYIEKDVDGNEKQIHNMIFRTGREVVFNRFVDISQISEIIIDDIALTRAET